MDFPPEIRALLAAYARARGFDSRAATVKAITEMRPMFTGHAPLRPGYLARRDWRRAYIRYYLPINLMKVRAILDELARYADLDRPLRVLDFGCGPGSAALAFLLRGNADRLALVDLVEEALNDADFLVRTLSKAQPTLHDEPPAEEFDLVFASNVLVERRRLDDLLDRVAPGGYLVVVEPAMREPTRRLMEWRDELVSAGWRVAAPCLDITACPMRPHSELWCHQDVGWTRPPDVAEMDPLVGVDHTSLKYAYLVVTRTGRTLADLRIDGRVVSNVHKEKGKAWAYVCGRHGPLCRVEVLSRHRGPDVRDFFHSKRGDLLTLQFEGEKTRTEGPIHRV